MPPDILNLEKHLPSRSLESLYAFAGLELDMDALDMGGRGAPDVKSAPGLMTVSLQEKTGGKGALVFTFIIDARNAPGVRIALDKAFEALNQAALNPHFGQDFEYMMPLKTRETGEDLWFVQELHFEFSNVRAKAREFVERYVVPVLQKHLPLTAPDLQFMDEAPAPGADPDESATFTFSDFFADES